MKSFLKIRRASSGFIGDYLNDAGGPASDYIMNITSAIVPPVGFQEGYYIIFGVLFDQSPKGLFKLLWIHEHMDKSKSELVSEFIDAARRFEVETVYCSRGHSVAGGEGKKKYSFFNVMYNAGIKSMAKWRLMPAPSVEDVMYGFALVQEYIREKAVNRPEDSLYKRDLTKIGVPDTKDPDEVNKLFRDPSLNVFHAVRYILAGIERDILPTAKPGVKFDLEAHRFFKPNNNQSVMPVKGERGFFV